VEGERERRGRDQLEDQGGRNPPAVGAGELMTDLREARELGGEHRADGQNDRDDRQLARDLAG
jgi:hypothetical protein